MKLLFYNGYQFIKQKYILPLSQHHLPYQKIKKNGIKNLLYRMEYNRVVENGNQLIFTIREKTLFESLLSDIWLFYIRSVLQYDATQKIYGIPNDFCPNWSIVTDYYTAFFDVCTLLRLVGRGNVFFDGEYIKHISSDLSNYLGKSKSISSNMIYTIEKESDDFYNLILTTSGKKTHEIVWLEIKKLIDEMNNHTISNEKNSIEKEVLILFEQAFKSLGITFPSQLRNQVNYQPIYGKRAIEHTIPAARAYLKDGNWLTPLYRFGGETDDQTTIEIFKCYAQYINILKTNLIHEYLDLQNNRGSGIYSAINKYRESKLSFPTAEYKY